MVGEGIDQILEHGGIEKFVDLLQDSNASVVGTLLLLLSQNDACAERIIDHSGILLLVQNLESDDEDVKIACADILQVLCDNSMF